MRNEENLTVGRFWRERASHSFLTSRKVADGASFKAHATDARLSQAESKQTWLPNFANSFFVKLCGRIIFAKCLPISKKAENFFGVQQKMEFLAIECQRISRKLNISAALEQQAKGLGP